MVERSTLALDVTLSNIIMLNTHHFALPRPCVFVISVHIPLLVHCPNFTESVTMQLTNVKILTFFTNSRTRVKLSLRN